MSRKKTILVAPLDWGLGHATRCIPIINELLSKGHEVLIATDGRAFDLLESEFPQLKFIRLKGYNPIYPQDDRMVMQMSLQVPKFLRAIMREHFVLHNIIQKHSIDAVISDNRFGMWTKEIPCALITHQLFIQMPKKMKWLEASVNRLNHFFIRRFTRCWVPDVQGDENLSSALSHGEETPPNVEFIGMLSRFTSTASVKKYDLLILLSGPEPQRTILEEKIIRQMEELPLRTLIVRGVTEENKKEQLTEMIERVSYLTSEKLNEALLQADAVICRPGYSSLMELASLAKSAVLIPTPGQTEQEYLAERCSAKGYFVTQRQDELNLQEALFELKKLKAAKIPFEGNLFKDILKGFLEGSA